MNLGADKVVRIRVVPVEPRDALRGDGGGAFAQQRELVAQLLGVATQIVFRIGA